MQKNKFSFTYRNDETELSFSPTTISPFGIDDIVGSRSKHVHHTKMKIKTSGYTRNGIDVPGEHTMDMPIEFAHAPLPYALVPNGWLPMAFANSSSFLVDRNVVSELAKTKRQTPGQQTKAVDFWMTKILSEQAVFNPILYAYESSYRKKPSFSEFIQSFKDAEKQIKDILPGSEVIRAGDEFFDATYRQLCDFDERYGKESEFLRSTIGLVVNRVGKGKEKNILKEIIKQADTSGVNRASLCVLSIISMLYEVNDGIETSIGREVLKTIKNDGDIFNRISDLRNIEIASVGASLFSDNPPTLCTCDDGVAKLWCATNPIAQFNNENLVDFTMSLDTRLFGRLDIDGVIEVKKFLSY